MASQLILETDDATLWFHPELRMVHHSFKRFIAGQAFRDVLTRGAEVLEKNKATKWLSDDRSNNALPKDDEKWGNEVWFPRVIKAGWKHWGIVQPAKVVGQQNMKRFQENFILLGVNAKMFSEVEEAMKWLSSQ